MSEVDDLGHGNTPAAWTVVVILLLAFTIGTFAFWFEQPWLVWSSVALAVVGLIVGGVMRRLGYGKGGSKLAPSSH